MTKKAGNMWRDNCSDAHWLQDAYLVTMTPEMTFGYVSVLFACFCCLLTG